MGSIYDTGVRPLIDEYLKKKGEEKRSYGEYWSASSAGYCMRKVIFERLGVPYVTEDARKTRVFEAGHVFHQWAQNITKKAGISIAQELELLDEDLKIKGHFDDLVLVDGGECPVCKGVGVGGDEKHDVRCSSCDATGYVKNLILYDYKTAHSKWFEYKRTNAISYYHKMQLGTYMYMLRKIPGNLEKMIGLKTYPLGEKLKNLTEARILHISKDDLRLAESVLMWSDELEKEVVAYWVGINDAWRMFKYGGIQSTDERPLPPCTCADHENGFLAKPKWNPYFYEGEPCSIKWMEKWKAENAVK